MNAHLILYLNKIKTILKSLLSKKYLLKFCLSDLKNRKKISRSQNKYMFFDRHIRAIDSHTSIDLSNRQREKPYELKFYLRIKF